MTTIEFHNQFSFFKSALFSLAIKLTKSREDAEDLLQETALKAFKNRKTFQLGSNFKAWIMVIMRNTFINHYRKAKNKVQIAGPVDSFAYCLNGNVANNGEVSLTIKELKSFILNLGKDYSQPFLLSYNGYRYDEIAEQLNIPIGTVKSRIFFARKRMREAIQVHY